MYKKEIYKKIISTKKGNHLYQEVIDYKLYPNDIEYHVKIEIEKDPSKPGYMVYKRNRKGREEIVLQEK